MKRNANCILKIRPKTQWGSYLATYEHDEPIICSSLQVQKPKIKKQTVIKKRMPILNTNVAKQRNIYEQVNQVQREISCQLIDQLRGRSKLQNRIDNPEPNEFDEKLRKQVSSLFIDYIEDTQEEEKPEEKQIFSIQSQVFSNMLGESFDM